MFAWLANREIIALNAFHAWGKVEKGLTTLSGNQKNGPAWAGKLRAGAGEKRSSTENEVLLAIMRYTLGYGFEWVTLSANR